MFYGFLPLFNWWMCSDNQLYIKKKWLQWLQYSYILYNILNYQK